MNTLTNNDAANEQNTQRHSGPPLSARTARTAADYMRHHLYRPTPQGHNRQVVADILNRQYARKPTRPLIVDTPLTSPLGSQISLRGFSRPASLLSMRSSSATDIHGEKRVHFNDRVEQCIAVSVDSDNEDDSHHQQQQQQQQRRGLFNLTSSGRSNSSTDSGSSDSDSDSDSDSGSSDDNDTNSGLFLGLRRPSAISNSRSNSMIAALPATTLKYSDNETSKPETVVVGAPGSSISSRRPGFNAQYAPHSVQTYQIVDKEVHPVDIL